MSLKTVKYFKQSDESPNSFISLDAWQSRLVRDSDPNSNKTVNSVTLKIFGNSYRFSYNDFTKAIQQKSDYLSDLTGPPMPIAIRAIKNNVYAIERPPFKTSVRLTPSRAARVSKEASTLCEIWIPWTVSILTMPTENNPSPSFKMFYNDGPLQSLDENIIVPWTPNFHHSGEICLGETVSNFTEAVNQNIVNPNSVTEVYHYLINDYFNGGWNLDLGGGVIYNICNYGIGKFTTNPLKDSDLAARAASAKVKIVDSKKPGTRDSTRVKNSYLTWSLMDLSEVLFAVSEYKKQNRTSYNVNSIIETEVGSLNEKESISSVMRSIYLSNSHTVNNSTDWYIVVSFSKELIVNTLVNQGVFTSIESAYNYQTAIIGSVCESAARQLIDENEQSLVSFIESSLESIATNILSNPNNSQKIEIDFSELIENKEDSTSNEKESVV